MKVINGQGVTTITVPVWDNPSCQILLGTLNKQSDAEAANNAALAEYTRLATNYQQAAIDGRLETTVPALVWPVKPKMQVVGDPFLQNGVLMPGVATEVDFYPPLVDFVPPKTISSSGPATAVAWLAGQGALGAILPDLPATTPAAG